MMKTSKRGHDWEYSYTHINDCVLQKRHHIYLVCKTEDLGIKRNFTCMEQTMFELTGVLIHWPHFTGREAEVQGSEMTCAKSHR